MSLTTQHLLLNMACPKNCGWQAPGHFDGESMPRSTGTGRKAKVPLNV
jgi:hypothetical protein